MKTTISTILKYLVVKLGLVPSSYKQTRGKILRAVKLAGHPMFWGLFLFLFKVAYPAELGSKDSLSGLLVPS